MFEPELIQDELDVYNPLIPDGSNWKATFMVEYPKEDERRQALARLIGIEDVVWVRVDGFDKVHPFCNEDLDRSDPDKTASIHFMRFELTPEMCAAVKAGAGVSAGVDHAKYTVAVQVSGPVRDSLAGDLA
jgi:hypothetical protein